MQRMNEQRTSRAAQWGCLVLGLFILLSAAMGNDALAAVFAEASGGKVVTKGNATIDMSHIDQGYIMVRHSKSSKRLKVQITCGDQKYNYDLNSDDQYVTYPLQMGNGSYKLIIAQQKSGTSYETAGSVSFEVKLSDANAPYLAPNQYVWYTQSMNAVAKSYELCQGLSTDMEKTTAIYNYVSQNVYYDHLKAVTVSSPYLPVVDDTLATGMGICFDYAALFACMMRVQGIPTQLVVGKLTATNPVQNHAWNKVYIDGKWLMLDPTFRNSGYTKSDYAEERFY